MTDIEAGLKALAAVQAVFPEAILAGGYLRDSLEGRTPRDIDIFVPHCDLTPNQEALLEHLKADRMTGAAEYMEQTEVCDIWDIPVEWNELPVQIIMLSPGLDPVDRAKGHDFGICQVWHNGACLAYTAAYFHDCADRTFTLVACEDEAEYRRSMRRWDRLKEKYPEYTLVVPKEFQKYAEFA